MLNNYNNSLSSMRAMRLFLLRELKGGYDKFFKENKQYDKIDQEKLVKQN